MNYEDALNIMNRHFEYRGDGLIDTYRILKFGKFKGDCDDFAITLGYLLAGSVPKLFWKLFRGEYRMGLYEHITTGTKHVALEVDGYSACNITRAWSWNRQGLTRYGYKRKKTVPAPVVLVKYIAGFLKV